MLITTPPAAPRFARLTDRALIEISGSDWRGFLQGLVTQDVETLSEGEARFGALLTPQGRVLFDLFLIGRDGGCLIDCAADRRGALIQRLTLYRLRAKVLIVASDRTVCALWDAPSATGGWLPDPRLAALGWRGYGEVAPEGALEVGLAAYEAHRLASGVPGPADWGEDRTYPIEANFDLLHGVDFKKGCFVGQETTSRMKRRGTIKTRMALIGFDGESPPSGSELLAGDLRAGEVLSAGKGLAMAFVRLDRLESGALQLTDGRAWRVERALWEDPTAAL
jgi:folate-binding protein YgfZ